MILLLHSILSVFDYPLWLKLEKLCRVHNHGSKLGLWLHCKFLYYDNDNVIDATKIEVVMSLKPLYSRHNYNFKPT